MITMAVGDTGFRLYRFPSLYLNRALVPCIPHNSQPFKNQCKGSQCLFQTTIQKLAYRKAPWRQDRYFIYFALPRIQHANYVALKKVGSVMDVVQSQNLVLSYSGCLNSFCNSTVLLYLMKSVSVWAQGLEINVSILLWV